ncbi:MAG: apolipoprotein N-acyltransferase [Planctomycetaceae bacterium]|nr:apolipoprotein N-acyltransferase [Planctomycetaceae bacterium]
MSSLLTDEPRVEDATSPMNTSTRPDIGTIISRGRNVRPNGLAGLLLSLASGLFLWLAFTPMDWGPVAWFALVPLLLLVRVPKPTRWMYRGILAGSLVFWLVTLQWMRLGHATMYFALAALAFYLALLTMLVIGLSRVAVHSLKLPMVLAVPICWTGIEYLRGHLFTGFSWYLLGHTQHNWVEIIQVSDLFGGYAVSFLVAAANAALVMMVPTKFFVDWQLCWPQEAESLNTPNLARSRKVAVAVSLGLMITALLYGGWRRSSGEFPIGPRVSLIQGNFVATLDPAKRAPANEIFMTQFHLTGQTVPSQPDIVVWPEAMFPYPMWTHQPGMTDEQLDAVDSRFDAKTWKSRASQEKLAEIADMTNAALVFGINTFEAKDNSSKVYNSAAFVQPGIGVTDRYDKIHRVPFGEYIPLKSWIPFINNAKGYSDYGITAGREVHVFKTKEWRLLPIVCFEDTVPHLVRDMVASAQKGGKPPVDLLVNMTNDGWFHGSSELDQHLITASFRCIETRTPMVRAVNTGISAVIDGDGVVRDPHLFIDLDSALAGEPPREGIRDPKTGRYHKQLNCAVVDDVPLDPRSSLYVKWGDWFAASCFVVCFLTALRGITRRREQTIVSADEV